MQELGAFFPKDVWGAGNPLRAGKADCASKEMWYNILGLLCLFHRPIMPGRRKQCGAWSVELNNVDNNADSFLIYHDFL